MSLTTWALLVSACLAGAASPGPSIVLLSKTVMDGGIRAGVVFGLAHGLGIFFYAFLVGIIMIASSSAAAQMDFSAMMPAFAVAALTPLYGYFLKLISMQLD